MPKKEKSMDLFLNMVFSIYIYMTTVANHSIYLDVATIFLMISTAYMCLRYRRIFMSWYFILELIFIGYSFYQIKSGMVLFIDAAQTNLNTLIKCVAINLVVYNFILIKNDFNKVLSIYVSSIFFGIITLFVFGWRSLLVGRFLHDGNYRFLGQGAEADSNGTGMIAAIAFIICIYLYWRSYRSKCVIINITLLLCIFLTGSRKAIGLVIVGTFLAIYYMNPTKKLRNILFAVFLLVGGCFIVMKVPVFYNLLGSRIENIINFIQSGSTNEDSMNTRNDLIQMGITYIQYNPLYGYGLANYSPIVTHGGYYSHNNFIEILFSSGIIGFCIYYSKYLFVLIKVAINRFKKDKNLYTIRKILLGIFLIMTLFEYWIVTYFERNLMIIHLFVLALCNYMRSDKNTN